MSTADSPLRFSTPPHDEPITKLRARILEQTRYEYQIAADAGMSPSTLSRYVLGQKTIKPEHVMSLCEVLACDPTDLVGVELVGD